MRPKRKRVAEKGTIEIIEQLFHLLRTAPLRVIVFYYLGSLPFIMGLLYFWADMGKSAFAYSHLAGGAFVMALLFIWMKTWQAVYARELWALTCGDTSPRWNFARLSRLAVRQGIVQPSGLFLLPLALLCVVPFGRAYAVYQNMTVLDDASPASGGIRSLFRNASELSKLWEKQNYFLIWALSPYLLVTAAALFLAIMPVMAAITPDWTVVIMGIYSAIFMILLMPLSPLGVVIALNIATAILIIPFLLKALLGVQTVVASNPWAMLNGTFFAAVCGLTYLCMDPLMKAAYVLRCFYGQSLNTGEDLRVELKRYAGAAGIAIIACVLAVGIAAPTYTMAQENDRASPANGGIEAPLKVSPAQLDRALDSELKRRQYAWRLPRQSRHWRDSEKDEGIIAAFMRGVAETLRDWGKEVFRWIKKALKWIRDKMPDFRIEPGTGRDLSAIGATLRIVLYILLAVLLSIAGVLLYRVIKRLRFQPPEMVAETVDVTPDLEDEDTAASDLPEEGWLSLAQELIEKGELRLALRAVFLGILAHLEGQKLISIARFKSNRDYKHELERRAHAEPLVLEHFLESVSIYESIWYGMHETTRELLDRVMTNQRKLQTCEREK